MESKQLTCYIYCRVSTDSQEYSNDNQSRACTEYAKTNNYLIMGVFVEDGKSGRTTDRPEFQSMLKALEEHPVNAVVTYKIDRFARNVGDFNNIRKDFKKRGIRLLSVNEGGDVTEGLIGNIFASVAEWESDVIGQRTRDGLAEKFRTGGWPGWAPLGYQNFKQSKKDKGIVIKDPITAPLIEFAFRKYATGRWNLLKLTKILHKKGIRTRNGKPIAHSTIHQILTNPFYYGWMRWNGQEKKGNHDPIISEELFTICQQVAAKHRNFVIRERKHDFLLRGFIFCARCGRRYTAEWHYNEKKLAKKGGKIACYHCAKKSPCKSPYVESEELEKKVAECLKNIKFSKAFTDALTLKVRRYLKNQDKENAKIRRAYLNRREALIAKRKKLEGRLMDDYIDRATFRRLHDEIQADINNIDVDVSKLEGSRQFDFDLLEEVLALTRNIPKAYREAPQFLKRKYLHFFFTKIEVDNKKIVNTAYSPLIQELIDQQKVILRKNLLEDRNVNITSQFVRIFLVFEDFRFISQLREEMDKVRPAVAIVTS